MLPASSCFIFHHAEALRREAQMVKLNVAYQVDAEDLSDLGFFGLGLPYFKSVAPLSFVVAIWKVQISTDTALLKDQKGSPKSSNLVLLLVADTSYIMSLGFHVSFFHNIGSYM